MRLSKKQMIIVVITAVACIAAMIVSHIIVIRRNSKLVDTFDAQEFESSYETFKQSISVHIQRINKEYGEEFKQEREKEVDEALRMGKFGEPGRARSVLWSIENYESKNLLWEDDSSGEDSSWNRCPVTWGLVIDTRKPESLLDLREMDNVYTSVIYEGIWYGPAETDADALNEIIANNTRRYLYKFFEGKITREQLDGVFSECLTQKKEIYEVEKIFNGIDYNFQYWAPTQELRIKFYCPEGYFLKS